MGHHIAGALVTPVILTYNEAPNIARVLGSLDWAHEVVVVDSGSTDTTEQIACGFPNVRWLVRPFDNHGAQWTFGIRAAGDRAPYVLALDADYQVTPTFVRELSDRFIPGGYDGGIAGFNYYVLGRALLGSVYPAKPVIFRPSQVHISQPGHTQEVRVDGSTYTFQARLIHDDRKPVARFVASQIGYARLEAHRLREGTSVRWQDRMRRLGLMPLVSGLAAYARSGGPFRGSASLRYAYERTLFECLLAMQVLGHEHGHEGEGKEEAIPPHESGSAVSGAMQPEP